MKKFMLCMAAACCATVFSAHGMVQVHNQVSYDARLIDEDLRSVATMAPRAKERELDFLAARVAALQPHEQGLREAILARLYAQLPPRPVSANPVYQAPTRRMPRPQPTPQNGSGANGNQ